MHNKLNVSLNRKLQGHKSAVYCIDYDYTNRQIYSAGGEGWLVSWSPYTDDGKLIADVGNQIFSMCMATAEDIIAVGTMQGDLYLIDQMGEKTPRKKLFHQKGIFDIINCNGKLLTAGGDGKLGIWDISTAEIEESISITHQRLRSLALHSDGKRLAIGSSDGNIYLFKTENWSLTGCIKKAHESSVFSVKWLSENAIISGGRDAHMKVWYLDDLAEPYLDLSAHWYTINHLALHPEGQLLASASRDKTIRLWDTNDFRLLHSLDATKSGGHINSVNRLKWSDDGKDLYAASDDRTISIWNL